MVVYPLIMKYADTKIDKMRFSVFYEALLLNARNTRHALFGKVVIFISFFPLAFSTHGLVLAPDWGASSMFWCVENDEDNLKRLQYMNRTEVNLVCSFIYSTINSHIFLPFQAYGIAKKKYIYICSTYSSEKVAMGRTPQNQLATVYSTATPTCRMCTVYVLAIRFRNQKKKTINNNNS